MGKVTRIDSPKIYRCDIDMDIFYKDLKNTPQFYFYSTEYCSPQIALYTVLAQLNDAENYLWSSTDTPDSTIIGYGLLKQLTSEANPQRFAHIHREWKNSNRPYIFGSFSFFEQSHSSSQIIVPRIVFDFIEKKLIFQSLNFLTQEDKNKEYESLLSEIKEYLSSDLSLSDSTRSAGKLQYEESKISGEQFKLNVTAALEALQNPKNELEKVVLVRDVPLSSSKPFSISGIAATLAEQQKQSWVYVLPPLVGATPELLINSFPDSSLSPKNNSGDVLSLRVLAGTEKIDGETPEQYHKIEETLLNSTKQRQEHRLAVDSVIENLKALNVSLTYSKEPELLKLSQLVHLATDISLTSLSSEPINILDIVDALHPTAAVGGMPSAHAQEFIQEIEVVDRKNFAGPVGWMNPNGQGQWGIALRGGILENPHVLRLFVGAGIVNDSVPEVELEETQAKLSPMLTAIESSQRQSN